MPRGLPAGRTERGQKDERRGREEQIKKEIGDVLAEKLTD
jgi:hypothetical protein